MSTATHAPANPARPDRVPAASRQKRGSAHAPPEARREQIARAALTCFAEVGYERATVDMVAARAGLSKGSVYRFFPSKDALLLAVVERFEAAVLDALARTDGSEAVLPRLERAGRMSIELLRGSGDLGWSWFELLAHPDGRQRLKQLYRRARALLTGILDEGIRSGELRGGNAADLAVAALGLLEGVMLQAIIDPDFDAAACWPGAWAAIERGLARENS